MGNFKFKVLSQEDKEQIVKNYQTKRLNGQSFKAVIGFDREIVYRVLEEFGIPHRRAGGAYNFPQSIKPGYRVCSTCGVEKPSVEFGLDKRGANGHHYRCTRCCVNSALLRQYGITIEEYETQFEKQEGLCACCGKPESEFFNGVRKRLAVDHNHKTNMVRELLCRRCNVMLGFIETETDVDLVASLQNYSKRHNTEE